MREELPSGYKPEQDDVLKGLGLAVLLVKALSG
jgi:hypothetical protein